MQASRIVARNALRPALRQFSSSTGGAPIRRALISVSDKEGLAEFGQFLSSQGVEILSTGGTAKLLRDAGVEVKDVSDHTGMPEMMDGRVKTLHPKIHGGLLGVRSNPSHVQAMQEHDIAEIDLVVANLYPFESTVASGADWNACVENIDIGGPSMLRSAAKNHNDVTVVVHPSDYASVKADMEANSGATTLATRRRLAASVFQRSAAYEMAIAARLGAEVEEEGQGFPSNMAMMGAKKQDCRYGENPHQSAAFYAVPGGSVPGVANAKQVQGKELSYNNINDTDAAFDLVSEFDEPAACIIKHANPCGVGSAATLAEAYTKALKCDPLSAFGGIIALNRPMDLDTANLIAKLFAEVIIAPGASEEALERLAKKKNLRVLLTDSMPDPLADGLSIKSLSRGTAFLVQGSDNGRVPDKDLKVVTERKPTEQEMADLKFAFRVGKHVKSNAIVYCKDGATVGVGAGQMSRVDSARIAAWKSDEAAEAAGETAGSRLQGSVVASDAFFPFADGLEAAAKVGATAVIQPGGSVRDDEVIEAANKAGIAMVFTGMRHFRH